MWRRCQHNSRCHHECIREFLNHDYAAGRVPNCPLCRAPVQLSAPYRGRVCCNALLQNRQLKKIIFIQKIINYHFELSILSFPTNIVLSKWHEIAAKSWQFIPESISNFVWPNWIEIFSVLILHRIGCKAFLLFCIAWFLMYFAVEEKKQDSDIKKHVRKVSNWCTCFFVYIPIRPRFNFVSIFFFNHS